MPKRSVIVNSPFWIRAQCARLRMLCDEDNPSNTIVDAVAYLDAALKSLSLIRITFHGTQEAHFRQMGNLFSHPALDEEGVVWTDDVVEYAGRGDVPVWPAGPCSALLQILDRDIPDMFRYVVTGHDYYVDVACSRVFTWEIVRAYDEAEDYRSPV